MSILLIAGSPTERSRSSRLLEYIGQRLVVRGVKVDQISVRDLPAEALLLGEFGDSAIQEFQRKVKQAQVIVIGTPVYKAAYSGALKVLLDVLPQSGLRDKTVLPIATAGSPHHMLAVDYALRPVLQSMGAKHILAGIYATDAQVIFDETRVSLDDEVSWRIEEAVETLADTYFKSALLNSTQYSNVHFSELRYSI